MSRFSFEFFPPKSVPAEATLWQSVACLSPLQPDFVSVTYGAGGSTRARTHDCVKRLHSAHNLSTAAHLTCVGASRADVDAVIDDYAAIGIKRIVALRGDMPDMGKFIPHENGYQSSVELVAALARRGGFEIIVSAYPEAHPQSENSDADIAFLKQKMDAGAGIAITQFCFDTDLFFRFRDKAVAAGITIPIIPGIMPTTNFTAVKKMAGLCGAHVPDWLSESYQGLEDEAGIRKSIAAAIAVKQCEDLLQGGFDRLHFYTLNQAEFAFSVCRVLQHKFTKGEGANA